MNIKNSIEKARDFALKRLIEFNSKVTVVSMDNKQLVNHKVKKFFRLNLNSSENCKKVINGMDIVFNVLGATGSPMVNKKYPGTFMVSNLQKMLE